MSLFKLNRSLILIYFLIFSFIPIKPSHGVSINVSQQWDEKEIIITSPTENDG